MKTLTSRPLTRPPFDLDRTDLAAARGGIKSELIDLGGPLSSPPPAGT